MQEGASKLLAACSQKEQALETSKSLLTCNARILALLSELQKVRRVQILQREPCRSDGVQGCMYGIKYREYQIDNTFVERDIKDSYKRIAEWRQVFVDIAMSLTRSNEQTL